ncbi:hypothetical protein, partial [Bifidobacterium erythrocebi]|uniref:hypothetical protein n=1 Tax=Bifidobacterium erythrocebi TaxID=2675325 RepID=UPI00197B8560
PSPGFQSRFFVLANENRTQDAGHALLRQGRNPKVRKISDVIKLSPLNHASVVNSLIVLFLRWAALPVGLQWRSLFYT